MNSLNNTKCCQATAGPASAADVGPAAGRAAVGPPAGPATAQLLVTMVGLNVAMAEHDLTFFCS